MATIRTAIQIQDGLSSAFKSMNIAMQATINSFESLQRASGHAVDTSSIEIARRELARAESAFNDIETQISQANQQQGQFNQSIRNGTTAASGMLGKIVGIAAAYLSFQTGKDILGLSDELTNTTARLNLMNDGMQTTAELQKMIYDSAQRSYGAYSRTADLVGKLGMNAKDAFSSNAETVAFAELLNKQYSIAGTNAEGITAATLQLTQALGSGVLRGEELNSIFEQAPNIIHTIADYLDVPIGAIREMAKEGQLTANVVKEAMFAAADDITDKFNNMPLTGSQIWQNFKNEALWAFQETLSGLNDAMNSEKFLSFVNDMKAQLYVLAEVVGIVFQAMASTAGFLYDNWSMIGPVVYGATAALVALGVAMAVVKIHAMLSTFWLGAQTLATSLLTASSWANVTATLAATAAAWGFNSALYANPILWVVMLVIALVAILYVAVAAFNNLAGTSVSATGIIVGVLMVALAFIGNLFVTFYNLVIDLVALMWNMFASFAEFLANVFIDPIGASMRLFADLADYVLGILQGLASAIDTIFGSSLSSAINGWRGSLDATVTAKYGEAAIDIPKMDSQALHLDRFDYGNAWDYGYNKGASLFSSFDANSSAPTSNFDDILNSLEGIQNAADKGADTGKDTAGSAKKLADSVKIASDDLKYLRDLSERESINRYTTAEIKVDMKNENHINSEMDIDGVINLFGEKVEEVAEILAEGGQVDV